MKRQKKDFDFREITNYDWLMAGVDVISFDRLIGQVFTHSELLGLNERQLGAYKSSLRKIFWDWYNAHFENPSGLTDVSHQARVTQGLEPHTTGTSTYTTAHTAEN